MTLLEKITQLVVNDYFTPNIKAEVILDTLLSEYIHDLVEGTSLVAKEMSIPKGDHYGSIGPKIDYVLAGDKVYLIELKTTSSSMDDDQAETYLNSCQDKPFGEILGRQLLFILDKPDDTFALHLDDRDEWGECSEWSDQTLKKAFQRIITKPFKPFHFPSDMKSEEGQHAENAKVLIRENKWTQRGKYRSRKYLYTLGQLADYPGDLWHKQMEVIYLTKLK